MNSAPQAGLKKYYASADYKVIELNEHSDPESYEKGFTFDTRLKAMRCVRSEITAALNQARQSIKHYHKCLCNVKDEHHRKHYRQSRQKFMKEESINKALLADIEAQIAKEST
jgi:hypothetical protein